MKRSRAFTLVELLVVIGIIAILIALLLPAMTKARIASVQIKCMAQHRQLMMAVLLYSNESSGWGPRHGTTVDGRFLTWYHQPVLGRFLGNRMRWHGDGQNTTRIIYCAARPWPDGDFSADKLGIGINTRHGSRIARDQTTNPINPQRPFKFTRIKRPAQVLYLVDTGSWVWEKTYDGDPLSTWTGGGTSGAVVYRHGQNTVVSFADGHVAAYRKEPNKPTGQFTGIDMAWREKQIFFDVNAIN